MKSKKVTVKKKQKLWNLITSDWDGVGDVDNIDMMLIVDQGHYSWTFEQRIGLHCMLDAWQKKSKKISWVI